MNVTDTYVNLQRRVYRFTQSDILTALMRYAGDNENNGDVSIEWDENSYMNLEITITQTFETEPKDTPP